MKRLIGLPGETVSEAHGVISIDGRPLSEKYVHDAKDDATVGTWHVPKGNYFLVGDDRATRAIPARVGAVVADEEVVALGDVPCADCRVVLRVVHVLLAQGCPSIETRPRLGNRSRPLADQPLHVVPPSLQAAAAGAGA